MATPRFDVVGGGILHGSYDAILLSTDLEPDDAVAIKALAPRLRGLPLLAVVGEGDADGKCEMMAHLLASYGLDAHATVVQGSLSKVHFPPTALGAFAAAAPSAASVLDKHTPAELEACVERFLMDHNAPFALLLKPPHELLGVSATALGRTVGTFYGSFNFVRLRQNLREADESVSEEEAFERQEALVHSLRSSLWVERSASVGWVSIDCTQTDTVWPALCVDDGLLRHIGAWSESTIRAMAQKVTDGGDKITAALGTEGAFDRVEAAAEAAEKHVGIILSIARTRGMQLPLADPLLSAVLLDDAGRLAPWLVRCRVGHDAKAKPTFAPDEHSNVVALLASPDEREVLTRTVLEILAAAMVAPR